MKLNSENLNWIYQHLDELERVLVANDYAREHRMECPEACKHSNDRLHDLIFSFLMVIMGESIPRTLWSVPDYSVLFGLIDENRDFMELSEDQ